VIYHLVERQTWVERSGEAGEPYVAVPGPEGFVHCCDNRQVQSVRAGFFPPGAQVVALALDPTLLDVETRYEPGVGGEDERFPHVFGPIARSAVQRVIEL
jgi:uncharacterized protein (DUF952 family)